MKEKKKYLDFLRHSCAHLLAAAVLDLYPNALPTIGPSIEDGFYYDFDFKDTKISSDDLSIIEAKMKDIVSNWKNFKKIKVDEKEALKEFKNNPYKKELIDELFREGKKLTIYQSGSFRDLCRGGHIDNPSKELKHFKLLSLAGAYWRGDEKNEMLTRIYGTAFKKEKELRKYIKSQERARKRDHRKLGKKLDFYSINSLTGAGLILWHPSLSIVRNIVESYWKEIHIKNGYDLVYTPHIGSVDMFVISRHLSKYIDYMFPVMLHQYIEGESAPDYINDEVLKPMNCPNHIQIYKNKPRSYKELPLRYAELGTVYRYERAGVLHGMTRVRGFTQDDTHIFCHQNQVVSEVRGILRLTRKIYNDFGFENYQAYLSTKPEKSLGSSSMWEFAQNALEEALKKEGIDYIVEEGEGAFYGPKIDSKIKDSLGRNWQLGTIQFDFNMPDKAETEEEEIEEFWQLKTFKQKFKTKAKLAKYLKNLGRGFDLTYVNKNGKKERVIMIHRTILGSMERFFGVLIEHYGGSFPLWLSPVQVVLIPISQKHVPFTKRVANKLKRNNIRCKIDDENDTMQAKIRRATLQKVPYMGIIGDKEIDNSNKKNRQVISVRKRKGDDLGIRKAEEFIKKLKREIEKKN